MKFLQKHGLLDGDFVQPLVIMTIVLLLGELL
jgi:hypothetical protein